MIPRLMVAAFLLLLAGEIACAQKTPLRVSANRHDRAHVTLDQMSDTLRWDDDRPAYAFRFPDVYGDDLRNQMFSATGDGLISGVLVAFPTRQFQQWTTGTPDLVVKLWESGDDSLPIADQELISDTLRFDEFQSTVFPLDSVWRGDSTQWTWIDLSDYRIAIAASYRFHAGYTAVLEPGDSLAILSDDGIPATTYASEWYNGHFVRMRDGWGGVNFLIRVVITTPDGVSILSPVRDRNPGLLSAYPNPFNPATQIVFELNTAEWISLRVFDVLGRQRAVMYEGILAPGHYARNLDASGWTSGMYFVRLNIGNKQRLTSITLLR